MVILQGISYLFIAFYHIQVIRTIRSKNRIFPQMTTSTMTPYVATRMRQHVILTRKVILITGLYLVCWIPFQVMITIFSACPHGFLSNDDIHCGISGNRFTVPATMATMNSLVNSIVYIFAFKKFRKALKEMVWCTREKQSLVTTDSIATVTEPSRDKPQTLKSWQTSHRLALELLWTSPRKINNDQYLYANVSQFEYDILTKTTGPRGGRFHLFFSDSSPIWCQEINNNLLNELWKKAMIWLKIRSHYIKIIRKYLIT